MTTEELQKLLSEATPGPWGVCGDEPWNLTVNYEPQGRVCFLAHSNGLNDDRDFANARLIALAPTLAAENIAMRADLARLRAALAEAEARTATLVAAAYGAAVKAIEALPRRKEPIGGQMVSYVQIAEAITAIRALAQKEADAVKGGAISTGPHCDCGMIGPCMFEKCRHPLAANNGEAGE